MSKLSGRLLTRIVESFPFALVCVGLVVTFLWTSWLVAVGIHGLWSAISG